MVQKQDPLEPSAYQQSLDTGSQAPQLTPSTVKYWSDFSRVYYHPRSLVQLYDYELNSSTMPFERFPMGTELFDVLDKEHDLVDRDWRPFAEECDRMQGIQVFTTIDDAWGGFASSYLESLRDEYPKTCIWVWGLQNPMIDISRGKRQLRLISTAHSIGSLCSKASTLVPLALPQNKPIKGLDIDMRSIWHTSAAMAAAIESATLPSRLKITDDSQPGSLDYLAESVNPAGNQPLTSLKMSISGDEADKGSTDIDFFQIGDKDGRVRHRDPQVFGEVSLYRGIDAPESEDQDQLMNSSRPVIGNPVTRKYVAMSSPPLYCLYFKSSCIDQLRYETSLRFPLLDSYPHIFQHLSDQENAGIQTTLASNSSISPRIKMLKSQVIRSLALEERENLGNDLSELADAYREDWSSGSDEDDDDL